MKKKRKKAAVAASRKRSPIDELMAPQGWTCAHLLILAEFIWRAALSVLLSAAAAVRLQRCNASIALRSFQFEPVEVDVLKLINIIKLKLMILLYLVYNRA